MALIGAQYPTVLHFYDFFQGAVFLLIILLALFGNLLVIVSVLRTKNLRSISCQNCRKGLTKINTLNTEVKSNWKPQERLFS